MGTAFDFHSHGIGTVLYNGRLMVPVNQRPYAWTEAEVKALLQDIYEAIDRDDEDYFLGTIVLVQTGRDVPVIADGQQRLATSSILLARIRDRQFALNREGRAKEVDYDFLRRFDSEIEENVARLQLNVEDHDFFVNHILPSPLDPERPALDRDKLRPSNEKLLKASEEAEKFIDKVLAGHREDNQSDILRKWTQFLRKSAQAVVITVTDEVGAYRMFETMNDRGLRASQADILKNFLFMKSGTRVSEAQTKWNTIVSNIETIGGDPNERLVTYLRHFWILTYGPTKGSELAGRIKKEITGPTKAMNFLTSASDAVRLYVALWSSKDPIWADHRPGTRQSIGTIAEHLQVEQIRPLLFAIVRHLDHVEAEKALRLCVSWSVRFLIYGGRGGMLDTQYSLRAQEIGTGAITKARELRERMLDYVPTDEEFETAFETARVSRPRLARYYLRALEKTSKGEREAEFVPNEEVRDVTLDHVLPLNPGYEWNINDEEAEAVQKLLGNMVLIRASDNRDLGNKSFAEKRRKYAQSGYFTTKIVADEDKWGIEEIKRRQAILAELAVMTWHTSFGEEG
ncbi:MAG TPA: DUF262 domain-containing protein [Sphingomicrobium sp.]|jgi:hypothetical protein|nr:DUF262 domain-containing protein [Sphingomicrobium sp.]